MFYFEESFLSYDDNNIYQTLARTVIIKVLNFMMLLFISAGIPFSFFRTEVTIFTFGLTTVGISVMTTVAAAIYILFIVIYRRIQRIFASHHLNYAFTLHFIPKIRFFLKFHMENGFHNKIKRNLMLTIEYVFKILSSQKRCSKCYCSIFSTHHYHTT